MQIDVGDPKATREALCVAQNTMYCEPLYESYSKILGRMILAIDEKKDKDA